MSLLSQRVQRIGTENAFKIGPYINEVAATGLKVIRCNLGEPDFPLPAHIRDEVKRQLDADMTHYVDPQGMLPLREAIAAEMGARRGLAITPDRVVVFPGGKPPIGFCQEAYCDPGDEVIYPSPGFPIYESFTNYLGLTPVPLHLDERKGFSVHRRRPRTADHAAHQADHPELPVESHRRRRIARAARVDRLGDPREGAGRRTHLRGRDLREHPVRRQPALLDRIAAGHGGAHHHCLRRLEVLLVDRRAHRLGGAADRRRGGGVQDAEHQLLLVHRGATTSSARSSRSSRLRAHR